MRTEQLYMHVELPGPSRNGPQAFFSFFFFLFFFEKEAKANSEMADSKPSKFARTE